MGRQGRGAAHGVEFVELRREAVDLRCQQPLTVEHPLQPLVAFDHHRLQQRHETRRERRYVASPINLWSCRAHLFIYHNSIKGSKINASNVRCLFRLLRKKQ